MRPHHPLKGRRRCAANGRHQDEAYQKVQEDSLELQPRRFLMLGLEPITFIVAIGRGYVLILLTIVEMVVECEGNTLGHASFYMVS
jgi:hypothetical protein